MAIKKIKKTVKKVTTKTAEKVATSKVGKSADGNEEKPKVRRRRRSKDEVEIPPKPLVIGKSGKPECTFRRNEMEVYDMIEQVKRFLIEMGKKKRADEFMKKIGSETHYPILRTIFAEYVELL